MVLLHVPKVQLELAVGAADTDLDRNGKEGIKINDGTITDGNNPAPISRSTLTTTEHVPYQFSLSKTPSDEELELVLAKIEFAHERLQSHKRLESGDSFLEGNKDFLFLETDVLRSMLFEVGCTTVQ